MILVAPTSFKGTISAADAARALADGVRDAFPHAEVVELPVSDGGPGLIDALRAAAGGELRTTRVHDPLGREVEARILLLEVEHGTAAIVESADACGMHLLARAELDPLHLGSGGVGELIEVAAGLADMVVVGLGGSATVDGGVGMATALGWRFHDADGRDLEPGGAALRNLAQISPAFARTFPRVVALADVRNPLLGPLGAARVFGPQKGASADDVELLEQGLARLAATLGNRQVAQLPGTGAGGGLGAGCHAFLGARLEAGADWVLRAVGFDALIAHSRLVITGEGSYDAQSSMGKVTGEVIARAATSGVPVLLVAGRVEGPVPSHVTVASGSSSEPLRIDDLRRHARRLAGRADARPTVE